MTIKTVKMSSGHQVYLPDEVLEASKTEEGQSFLIRVRGRIIELVPVDLAEKALEEGLANLQRASLDHLTDRGTTRRTRPGTRREMDTDAGDLVVLPFPYTDLSSSSSDPPWSSPPPGTTRRTLTNGTVARAQGRWSRDLVAKPVHALLGHRPAR